MSITKKPVLLVVSFGTSFADAREQNITAIEVDGVFEARRMNPGEYVGAGK